MDGRFNMEYCCNLVLKFGEEGQLWDPCLKIFSIWEFSSSTCTFSERPRLNLWSVSLAFVPSSTLLLDPICFFLSLVNKLVLLIFLSFKLSVRPVTRSELKIRDVQHSILLFHSITWKISLLKIFSVHMSHHLDLLSVEPNHYHSMYLSL